MIRSALILCVSLFLVTSCDPSYKPIYSNTVIAAKQMGADDTLILEPATKTLFSRLKRSGSFGIIDRYKVPAELSKEKEFDVIFWGRARTNYAYSNASINVSVGSKSGVNLVWNAVGLKYFFTDLNTWCYFKDSIHLKHESWQEPYFVINTFACLGNSPTENFDVDTLHVQIKVKE